MSVDERLRAGLRANVAGVVPQGESRLAATRSRHRRRVAWLSALGAGGAAAAVALAVSVAGGADRTAPEPEPLPPATSSAVPAPADGTIPESTWRKVVTRAQALDEGVAPQRIRDDIGADDRLPLEMRFDGDAFTQTGDFGGSVWEIGDSGSTAYDGRGRLVVTSHRCDGCDPFAVTWRVVGNRLVITGLDPRPGPMARTVWLGTWRRTE